MEFDLNRIAVVELAFPRIAQQTTSTLPINMPKLTFAILICFGFSGICPAQESLPDTLPKLVDNTAPKNLSEMWSGFDPKAEPLETETVKEWEEDGVILKIVRFRIGVFKGKRAILAAVYGYPKSVSDNGRKIPGLVQIHGGGQYADYKACLTNAKRGYATVSIAWAGRISASEYKVSPNEVRLFWDEKKTDPRYRLTTDWGVVDAYHAPSKNPRNNFPSANPAAWTIDPVESPRNSPWFLCAIAARRALTFLESRPEVDAEKLGVYGHSMGGKLTVMASVDSRVKAAAPSCGGISDRYNASELFNATIGDNNSLEQISCPIIFLSPANDFHGRIGDLPTAVQEIKSKDWRVTCSPHHNHQDTAEYEVATQLWFDQHLKGKFRFPQTPSTKVNLINRNGIPSITIAPDDSRKILSVDVFYTQHGKPIELPADRENTMSRFWRHVSPNRSNEKWLAQLPISSTDKPLWVYANVKYALPEPVSGAGYYYGKYTANTLNVSSMMEQVSPEKLKAANVAASIEPSLTIETFEGDWKKEWFTYKPDTWPISTHKLFDSQWKAPLESKLEPKMQTKLALEVLVDAPNQLVVLIDDHAAEVELNKPGQWQAVELNASDLKNFDDDALPNWQNIRRLKLGNAERLRSSQRGSKESKIIGKNWKGADPKFRNLRWIK